VNDSLQRKLLHFYQESVLHLGEARVFAFWAAATFFLGGVAGFFNPSLSDPYIAALAEFAENLRGRGGMELALFIFLRNASAAATAVLFGIFFGLIPFVGALVNGLLAGAVFSMAPGEIWKVIPHGVFELPAMFLAWGLGIWSGMWIFSQRRWEVLKDRLRKSIHVYLALIIPILLIAALIEGLTAVYIHGF
jgi:uncharacterized membrane protein SpoIIM required for sporulation